MAFSPVAPKSGNITTENNSTNNRSNDRRQKRQPAVSVILPTFNEVENLPILINRLTSALVDFDFEIIVVDDDSPDLTWQAAFELAETDYRIHVLHRIGKRGLSSAVIDGMHVASGEAVVVMDADLQHDETIIPRLVEPILTGESDISVGSREVEGGSYGDFGPLRRFVSWGGATIARRLLQTPVSDPMSGFFAVSCQRFNDVKRLINPRGFKILLEFLARGSKPNVVEVGYQFKSRVHGTTKLTSSILVAYLLTVLDLTAGRIFSSQFLAYGAVGSLGLIIRLLVSMILIDGFSISEETKPTAAFFAFEVSFLANYWANNSITFSSVKHRGLALIEGCVKFHLVSFHGLVVQTGLVLILTSPPNQSKPIFQAWPDIPVVPFLASILLATVGNYYLNSFFTWKPSSR